MHTDPARRPAALVPHLHLRQPCERIRERFPPLRSLRRLLQIDRRRLGLTRHAFEILAYEPHRFFLAEVSHETQHCVVRRVVRAEELRNVRDARRIQILHRSDRRMLVGEVVVEHFAEALVCAAVRLVVDAQAPLFLHRVTLIVQLLLRDLERAHAIGFQKQRELELVRGQRLEVEREIGVRRAVHRSAVREHLVEVFAVADVLRALEHHVLEEVREAGEPLALVARADVVRDVKRNDGRAVVLHELHAQTILQRDLGELHADLRRRRSIRQRHDRNRQNSCDTIHRSSSDRATAERSNASLLRESGDPLKRRRPGGSELRSACPRDGNSFGHLAGVCIRRTSG